MEKKWVIKISSDIRKNPETEEWEHGVYYFPVYSREEAYAIAVGLWDDLEAIQFSSNEAYIKGGAGNNLMDVTNEFVIGECNITDDGKGMSFEMVSIERDFIHDEPRQAVFWVKNKNNVTLDIIFITEKEAEEVSSFNHKLIWENCLNKKNIENHPYNYYPRGRVVVRGDKAVIYANPDICSESLKKYLITMCNLHFWKGIKTVEMKADGSAHYQYIFND